MYSLSSIIQMPSVSGFRVVSGYVKLPGYVNNDIHYKDNYIHALFFFVFK